MVGLKFTDSFTGMFENESGIRRSHAGMAHFAGTGPKGAICKECAFFCFDKESPRKEQPCRKYSEMASGKKVKGKIPYNTAACKYYEARK